MKHSKMPSEYEKIVFQAWNVDSLSRRADSFLSLCLGISRNQLQKRLQSLTINHKESKFSFKVRRGDLIEVKVLQEERLALVAEELPLEIIYEDSEMIVVNKQQGVVVHPGDGHSRATLIQGLLFYDRQLEQVDTQAYRLGLVHRLDKDTSGVILVAKNNKSHEFLSQQFAMRRVEKHYLAVVHGQLNGSGLIDAAIARDPYQRKKFTTVNNKGGKTAQTRYRVLQRWGNYALVKLQPETGRTHQLRCHLQHLKSPILGDPIYARKDPLYPQATLMLHALALKLQLPSRVKGRNYFYAPLPLHFKELLRKIATEQFSSNQTSRNYPNL